MKTLARKLILCFLAFLFPLALAYPAHAGSYGAVYFPSTAPSVSPVGTPESFLDGLTPGSKYVVKVALTNTGTLPWSAADPTTPVHLTFHWTGPAPIYNNIRTALPYDVLPGDSVTVNADLTTPSVPGTYTLHWDLVHENVTFFSDAGVPTADQIVGIGGRVGFDQGQAGEDLYQEEYCKLDDCDAGPITLDKDCVVPKIDSISTASLSQDSVFWVNGCGFDPSAELHLVLPDAKLDLEIKIQTVSPKLLGGDVPGNFGALDQDAYVYVQKQWMQSAHYPVKFATKKQKVFLSSQDIQVSWCSFAADYDACNDVTHEDPNVCCILETHGLANPINSFATIGSYHYTTGGAYGDSGADTYTVKLNPGWTLEEVNFSFVPLDGGTKAGPVFGFIKGSSSASLTVPWSVGGNSGVAYYLDLYAVGPINTDPVK